MAEIRNPNLPGQDGGSGSGGDTRGLMAVTLLALVVFLGFQLFNKSKQPPAPPQPIAQSQSQPAAVPLAAAVSAQPQGPVAPAPLAAAATPAIAASTITETTVENQKYKIVFTNQGAQVRHWILKNFSDTAGKPLDMVQADAAARFGLPLSLFTYEPALNTQLTQALYQVTTTGEQPTVTGHVDVPATSALTFHYAENGLDVVKTIRFDSSYVITVEAKVTRNGVPVRALVQWPAGLGDMEEFLPKSLTRAQMPTSASSLIAWSIDGKQDSTKAKSVSGNATLDQSYQYVAVADLYFVSAFLPDSPERSTVVTLHNTIDLPGDLSDPNSAKKPADVIGLAVGDTSGATRLRLFAGPKETDLLKTIHTTGADGKPDGPTLESLIQYGWMTIIAKPMRIQPKVDAIKKKYANVKATDPKRAEMQTEMMALYKAEGVNMYGSCLPMLIQMPLFFAYYRVLLYAVELRQAHWFWLTDLSAADPKYILFIIIIVCMPVTQLITPSPGMDPAQRRMMAFMMPVMMGFILLRLPSGLGLYWATGNIINLAIQIGINQTHMGREMHAIAARKAAKKAGVSNKIIQAKR
ncbi:MAG: membrane protein insertase YidC [Terracidiphilus sp.]